MGGGGSQRLLCLNPTTVMVVLLLGLWLLLGCDYIQYLYLSKWRIFNHLKQCVKLIGYIICYTNVVTSERFVQVPKVWRKTYFIDYTKVVLEAKILSPTTKIALLLQSKGRFQKKKLVEFSTKGLAPHPSWNNSFNSYKWSTCRETDSIWYRSANSCQMASQETLEAWGGPKIEKK